MTPDENNSTEAREDSLLESAFQETAQPAQIDASWRRFNQYTLPEKQAWVAFHITRHQAHARLKTMTRWTHRR
ncbi:MAG: hypothetical protein QM758_05240 [Armatimonas sp.]